jgi:hypothetical protein
MALTIDRNNHSKTPSQKVSLIIKELVLIVVKDPTVPILGTTVVPERHAS